MLVAAYQQRGVHNVAVAHYPSDVRGRPPDVGGFHAEAPARHAGYAHLVSPLGVDRQLRLGGRAGGGQDIGCLVGLHVDVSAVLARSPGEEIFPVEVTVTRQGHAIRRPAQNDQVLGRAVWTVHGGVHNPFKLDIAPFAIGDVCGEDQAGAAGADAVGQGAGAKACEHHRVDCADTYGRQHQHYGFRAHGHIDGYPVAFPNAHSPQGGGNALHFIA